MKLFYTLLFLLITSFAFGQAETEPNNSFENANVLTQNVTRTGAVNTTTDTYDYYTAILPVDGTLKVYVEGTNTSAGAGYLYMYGYDRRKAGGTVFSEYIATSNVAAGANILDTILEKGRAADTFYFRVQTSASFSYKMRYEMVETSTNDAEPNGSFADAITINQLQEKQGHIGYLSNGASDAADYYKTVFPSDGTLKIYVKGTNTGAGSGYLFMYGYDRRKANGEMFSEYVGPSNITSGSTVSDTLTLYGRAADTFYYKIVSSQPFSYAFSYEMVDNSTNDVEPNGTFEQAITINTAQEKQGHIGYLFNGTSDADDYYKTVFPSDGTLKIYVKGTNTGASAGYLYMYGYDRRKASGQMLTEYVGPSNITAGSAVSDTLTLYGRAADTFYYKIVSSQPFSYAFSYEMVDKSANDIEPNGTFEQAITINAAQEKQGHIGYLFNGTNDAEDYYKTVFPSDGTLKIYVKGTNTGASAGYLYMYGYDRRKASGQVLSTYVGPSNVTAGTLISDTLTLYGRAADTFYYRVVSSQAFSYTFSYKMVDTSANDAEPNNSFEQANAIGHLQIKQGHIGYLSNGVSDAEDYYKTLVPSDGTMQVYVKATNTGAGSGYLYLYGYDKRKANGQVLSEYIMGSNVAAGATISDTLTLQCVAQDSFYFRIVSSTAFAYQLSYDVTLGKDTIVKVCPGYKTDISGLYNTAPFSTIKYENMANAGIAISPTVVGAGTYRLSVYNGTECTRDTAFITVALNPKPYLGADTTVKKCIGFAADITTVKNTAGYTLVEWSTPRPDSVNTGTYTLIVTNEFGCKDTAIITVQNNPKPSLGVDAAISKCPGFGANISALYNTAAYANALWSTARPDSVDAGTYNLIVTNEFGCKDTAIIVVTNYPKPSLGADVTIALNCAGTTTDITGVYNTAAYANVSYSTATPTSVLPGVYTLIVTNANGCKDTAIITVQEQPLNVVASAGANTKLASRECTDAQGWTNYYNDNGTPAVFGDDILVLSLKKNGNNIGTQGDGTFQVKTVATAGAGSNHATLINNAELVYANYWAMNRYWQVTATQQPATKVGVRFYYNNQDLADINGSHPLGNITYQGLTLYKTSNANPDPTTNLAGDTAIIKLVFGALASDTTFTYKLVNSNTQYVEFLVNSFSGGGAGAIDLSGTFPLTLLSFSGVVNAGNVVLNWNTAQEVNTKSFTVQRSGDGNSFKNIGTVAAIGSGASGYSFTDNNAQNSGAEKLYYRLQIADKDGAVYYSPVTAVYVITKALFTIFPNPATHMVYVKATSIKQVQVLDNYGKVVINKMVNNDSVQQINVSHLAKGFYLVRVLDKDGNTQTQKLIIQ